MKSDITKLYQNGKQLSRDFTIPVIYPKGKKELHGEMLPITELRKRNLRLLITTAYNGKAAGLAAALGKQPNIISRVFSDDQKHRRNIGNALAREIERVSSKPIGWMDTNHDRINGAEIARNQLRIEAESVLDRVLLKAGIDKRASLFNDSSVRRPIIESLIDYAEATDGAINEVDASQKIRLIVQLMKL